MPDFDRMDRTLALEAVRVTEAAALAASRLMGRGDERFADQVAVDAMRTALNSLAIDGTVVIGEGERDEAPMLFIGEKVGAGQHDGGSYPAIDIAVDPLEGTNLCATGSPNAIAVLAAAEQGGLLNAPDLYMEKLVAEGLDRRVEELVIVVLDRERHAQLISDIRKTGARIRLITDGDLSAAISAAVVGSGVHAVMGIGGAPEGVLAAAAMRCLNGEILARLVVNKSDHEDRCRKMGITDLARVYRAIDLASGDSIIFAATGVTDGDLMRGVRFVDDGIRTHSLIMQTVPHQVCFIDAIHVHEGSAVPRVRF